MPSQLVGAARVAIADLNDMTRTYSLSENVWLTHTVPYATWRARAGNILWYQRRLPSRYRDRDRIGISLANLLSETYVSPFTEELGGRHGLCRALYFQCELDEMYDGESLDPTPIFRSLISQILLMDCPVAHSLRLRLTQLESETKTIVRQMLQGRYISIGELSFCFQELLRNFSMPDILVIDNIHRVGVAKIDFLFKSLGALAAGTFNNSGAKIYNDHWGQAAH